MPTLWKKKTELRSDLEDFINVFNNNIDVKVSSKAARARKEKDRHRGAELLPSSTDICAFKEYLESKRKTCLDITETLTYEQYVMLVETTGLIIEVFNRRRPGEIARTTCLDYQCAKSEIANSEFYDQLSNEDKKQRKKYKRIDIKGKKRDGKEGYLYITEDDENAIRLILQSRDDCGILPSNPYLFALQSGSDGGNRCVDLTVAIRNWSKKCSSDYKKIDHDIIRGTKLRKHIVTVNSTYKNKNTKLPQHLGHSQKTSDKYYKKTVAKEDVDMTRFLEKVNKIKTNNSSKGQKRKKTASSEEDDVDTYEVKSKKKKSKFTKNNSLAPIR